MKFSFPAIALDPNDETTPESGGTSPATTPATDTPLGEAGETALRQERSARKDLEKRLKAIEAQYAGIDPEDYKSLREFREAQQQADQERQQKELEAKQEYDKALATIQEKHNTAVADYKRQLAEKDAMLTERDRAIARKEVARSFGAAFATANGIPAYASMILNDPAIASQLKYDAQADCVLVINPATGDPVTSKDGAPLAIADWIVTNLKPKFLNLFNPDNPNSGGGTSPASRARTSTGLGMSFEESLKRPASEIASAARSKQQNSRTPT